ncbi:MAG: hypothetical protein LBT66_04300 [Methanobrevibacter sp.]|jgi:hypothetical protein|nr:hypothetical protein [Candidatus Methanovirga meridionalis]
MDKELKEANEILGFNFITPDNIERLNNEGLNIDEIAKELNTSGAMIKTLMDSSNIVPHAIKVKQLLDERRMERLNDLHNQILEKFQFWIHKSTLAEHIIDNFLDDLESNKIDLEHFYNRI